MITEIKEKGDSGFCDIISKLAIVARECNKIEKKMINLQKYIIKRNLRDIYYAIEEMLEVIKPLMQD